MSKNNNKINKRRLTGSYITTIISISLLLLLLGILGLIVLNAKKLSDYVKENIIFSVYINDDAKEVDVFRLQKILEAKTYVKKTRYVTREEAAAQLQESLGENFLDFLGYNPLLSSIDVYLYADYANMDSIVFIENELKNFPQVKEIDYQESLVHAVNQNIKKISLIVFVFSGFLFLIALTLINNTIRLAIYSKRFIINTMQIVGATKAFIRKPFVIKSIIHGIIGAVIANGFLVAIVYFGEKELDGIISFKDPLIIGILFLLILALGILINWLSTFFAVNRFLRIKMDNLYL